MWHERRVTLYPWSQLPPSLSQPFTTLSLVEYRMSKLAERIGRTVMYTLTCKYEFPFDSFPTLQHEGCVCRFHIARNCLACCVCWRLNREGVVFEGSSLFLDVAYRLHDTGNTFHTFLAEANRTLHRLQTMSSESTRRWGCVVNWVVGWILRNLTWTKRSSSSFCPVVVISNFFPSSTSSIFICARAHTQTITHGVNSISRCNRCLCHQLRERDYTTASDNICRGDHTRKGDVMRERVMNHNKRYKRKPPGQWFLWQHSSNNTTLLCVCVYGVNKKRFGSIVWPYDRQSWRIRSVRMRAEEGVLGGMTMGGRKEVGQRGEKRKRKRIKEEKGQG